MEDGDGAESPAGSELVADVGAQALVARVRELEDEVRRLRSVCDEHSGAMLGIVDGVSRAFDGRYGGKRVGIEIVGGRVVVRAEWDDGYERRGVKE